MTSIRKELAEYGLTPRKRWGQHFLVDGNILNKIVQTADIRREDTVLEVGPGLGEMTLALARQSKKVIAVEIDTKLVEVVRRKTASCPNVEVVGNDILKVDFKEFVGHDRRPIKVVANLPYHISTPLLFRFIEERGNFSTLTLMVQREVAERMVAPPGGKDYGPLSIFVQLFLDLSIRFSVKPSCFFPPPNVDSAVIHMIWKETPVVGPKEEDWFRKVVRGCLGYRRKTLMNALKHSGLALAEDTEGRMEKVGIDSHRRPETLAIDEYVRLSKVLKA
jgi:16S rRNA (adenine1518-N6/adenine1519-N6)-dimethyltransferase